MFIKTLNTNYNTINKIDKFKIKLLKHYLKKLNL